LKGSFLSVVGMVVIIYSLITVLAATALSLTVDSVRGPPFCFSEDMIFLWSIIRVHDLT
jgi:hypothetical protein